MRASSSSLYQVSSTVIRMMFLKPRLASRKEDRSCFHRIDNGRVRYSESGLRGEDLGVNGQVIGHGGDNIPKIVLACRPIIVWDLEEEGSECVGDSDHIGVVWVAGDRCEGCISVGEDRLDAFAIHGNGDGATGAMAACFGGTVR